VKKSSLASHQYIPSVTLWNSLINNLITQFKVYFPEGSIKLFDILMPANLLSRLQDVRAYSLQIKQLAKRFLMNEEIISVQFSNLISHMITDLPEQYCAIKTNDPVEFWVYFMKNPLLRWESEIKKLISVVLTLSPTTSEVERAFSIMAHVLTNRRRTLTDRHIEDIIRIRSNGPSINDFDPTTYVIHWLNMGHILSDADINKNNPKVTSTRRKSNLF